MIPASITGTMPSCSSKAASVSCSLVNRARSLADVALALRSLTATCSPVASLVAANTFAEPPAPRNVPADKPSMPRSTMLASSESCSASEARSSLVPPVVSTYAPAALGSSTDSTEPRSLPCWREALLSGFVDAPIGFRACRHKSTAWTDQYETLMSGVLEIDWNTTQ